MLRFRFPSTITLLVWFLAASSIPSACTATSGRRASLLDTIEMCIDLNVPDYCTKCARPRLESPCATGRACADTTGVWEETRDFVVIRDRKMCDCSPDFVHGLALPRQRVTGIEDERKPDAIWSFAWTAARKRIDDPSEIALAVNPPGNRSQDQLHVHIVRLIPGIRDRFSHQPRVNIRKLDDVWQVAAKTAEHAGIRDYGILVAADGNNGFIIVVGEESMEKKYTQWGCR